MKSRCQTSAFGGMRLSVLYLISFSFSSLVGLLELPQASDLEWADENLHESVLTSRELRRENAHKAHLLPLERFVEEHCRSLATSPVGASQGSFLPQRGGPRPRPLSA
ncbi:UNVERIFIED_CONTAM: hypothetical protein Sindi_1481400 [Sesamum indicum]